MLNPHKFSFKADNYFRENARFKAEDWTYYNPNPEPGMEEASTNNNSELLNSVLNSMLPGGRRSFAISVLTLHKFCRRQVDNKLVSLKKIIQN